MVRLEAGTNIYAIEIRVVQIGESAELPFEPADHSGRSIGRVLGATSEPVRTSRASNVTSNLLEASRRTT